MPLAASIFTNLADLLDLASSHRETETLVQLDYASCDSYFVEFSPTTIHERKFAYVVSNTNYMLVHHENNALCDGYIIELIHDALCVENLEAMLVLLSYAS